MKSYIWSTWNYPFPSPPTTQVAPQAKTKPARPRTLAYWIAYCIAYCIAYGIDPSCVSSRVLGRTGSWAGPAWFKMLLGLGGNQGGGGGKGVISCTWIITFHSLHRKTFLVYSSILTFRYASFGCDAIGKISYRWLDCYFTNVKLQISVNIGQHSKHIKQIHQFS